MIRYILVWVNILLFPLFSISQMDYNIDNIPQELLKNSGSVVRVYEKKLEVSSISEMKEFVKFAITILHESHRERSIFEETYDEFTKLSSIKIVIYDKNGKRVKNVPRKDIIDMTAFSKSSLFAAIRQKVYKPDYYTYPFTIEYSFIKSHDGILTYPAYVPVNDYNMAFQRGSYTIIRNGELKYKNVNFNSKYPIVTQKGEVTVYHWEFDIINAYRKEDYELNLRDIVPYVLAQPPYFEMENYKGNSESWKNFGDWIYSLNKDRDEFSTKTYNEVNNLISELKTKKEKVKTIYEYMQAKTRYVNITIGIGGWQPFTAKEVDENGYGDCKALSNYTSSLLNAFGIESYYAIIRAGDDAMKIKTDFPANQFNHAIVCVPDGNDTLWLECTSQRNPFNYMGSFTDGRYALVISPNNSKLVKTPKLTEENNYLVSKAKVVFNNTGDAGAKISKEYSGTFYDNISGLNYIDNKRRMDRVRNRIHIKNFNLANEDYEIEEIKSEHPLVKENYSLLSKKYVDKLGNRLLFDVNFFNTTVEVPSSINKQEEDIYLSRSLMRVDSIEFIIPDDYYIKSFPDNDTLISEFGKFFTNYSLEANSLLYVRKQVIKEGRYDSKIYAKFRNYLKRISRADKSKVLLLPKE